MSEANAVATRLPEFSQHEPLTWFRRAETRFQLPGIKQATTRADYILEALPETIFRRIGPWLDQQPDKIHLWLNCRSIPCWELTTHCKRFGTLSTVQTTPTHYSLCSGWVEVIWLCVHQRRCSQTTPIQPVQRPIPGTCKNRQELPRTAGQQRRLDIHR